MKREDGEEEEVVEEEVEGEEEKEEEEDGEEEDGEEEKEVVKEDRQEVEGREWGKRGIQRSSP